MKYDEALRVNRLRLLEERAEGYRKRAISSGNAARGFRAARLLESVNSRMMGIVGLNISSYR